MAEPQFINGKAALSRFMMDLSENVGRRLDSGNYNATGALKDSLSTEVEDGLAISGKFLALDYWTTVGSGVPPGRRPPVGALMEWAKAKGIVTDDAQARSFAIRVSSSILKRGSLDFQLKGKNVFTEAILEMQPRIPEVFEAFARDAEDATVRQFNRALRA